MKELSKQMANMQVSSVRKLTQHALAAEAAGKHVYRLNIGQPDLPVPQEYYDHIRAFDERTVEYMPSNGIPELLEAVSRYYREMDIDMGHENIAITTGGTEAVLFTLLALVDPGDEVIVMEPYYSNYNTYFTLTGVTPVAVTTYAENGFHFTKEQVEAKITDKTKAFWITNPGNPTGSVMTEEEIRIIADLAIEHDLYIVSDEVYREIVFDGRKMTSFGFLPEVYDRLIIIDSVSKRFSACGARIGVVMSKNEAFFAIVSKLCQGRLAVSTIEQHGAVGLYSTGTRVIHSIREEFERRRDVVFESLTKIPGLICKKPEGAFYMICKLPVEDATDFLIWMLKDFEDNGETVMAAPADGFYATEGLGKNEIRLAYVLEPEKLKRAIEILGKGLAAYQARK